MPPNVKATPSFEPCTESELLTLLNESTRHSIQLFTGIDAPTLRDLIDATPNVADTTPARPILFMGGTDLNHSETIVNQAIDQLAEVAGELWPFWFCGEDFSELNDDPLTHMYLQFKLTTVASRCPALSIGWGESAIRQALRGRTPRVPSAAPETEWSQLCHAISPDGLIIVVTLDEVSVHQGWPLVHALEWLATKGNVAIVVLSSRTPPSEAPFDHLLFRARAVIVSDQPNQDASSQNTQKRETDTGPHYKSKLSPIELVLSPVNGRPHPQSLIEQRLSKMINADVELVSKFIFNARVGDTPLKTPIVDLLWPEGRLIIELDGPEHRGRRAYREDRHRDYELLCAGYLVVRIPNDEIVEDFAKAIEKIRSLVRLRSSLGGENR